MRRQRTLFTITATVVAAAVAVGAAGYVMLVRPPGEPPVYDGDRPDLAATGYVSHTEVVEIAVPRAAFLRWTNDPGRELGDIVQSEGSIPTVAGTVPLRGEWDPEAGRAGDRRRVEFSDGHYLAEEVITETPAEFTYMIWGFTSAQRLAVRHGTASFVFEALDGDTTRVRWTYSLLPTWPVVTPFVERYVDGSLAPMMRATLAGMRDGAEAEAPERAS
jgi:hypothetical protein